MWQKEIERFLHKNNIIDVVCQQEILELISVVLVSIEV